MADFAPPGLAARALRFATFGLERPREELSARIDARVDAMMAGGLGDEVAALRRAGHGSGSPGMQAIGYREFLEFETESPSSLAKVVEAIKGDTRRYAKRQMTFFRRLPGIEWIGPDPEAFASRLRAIVHAASCRAIVPLP